MDCLSKYIMSDEEKEQVLMMTLRRVAHSRMSPGFYTRRKNFKTWEWINETYGNECSHDTILALQDMGLLEADGPNKPYKASKRGRECLKRGFISYKKDSSAKTANIIAVCALVVATLLNPQFWKVLEWLWGVITETAGTR